MYVSGLSEKDISEILRRKIRQLGIVDDLLFGACVLIAFIVYVSNGCYAERTN